MHAWSGPARPKFAGRLPLALREPSYRRQGVKVSPRPRPSRRGSAPPCSTDWPLIVGRRMVAIPLDCAETETVWPSARKPVTSGSLAPLLAALTFGCSPPTFVVGELAAPKSTMAVACCASIFQSSAPTSVFTTYWMMVEPPGEPVAIANSPTLPSAALRNTRVGAIELPGRLLACTRLATGVPEL